MEPTVYDIILAVVSIPSLILSFLSYRDRRTKDQSSNIESLAQKTDQRIRDLEESSAECDRHYSVLEERIANHIRMLDRVDEKLDKIIEKINDEE